MFVNTNYFQEAATVFKRAGNYCNELIGSPSYNNYWESELQKCIHGYEVAGVRITGDHYFYLNYCQIEVTEEDEFISKSRTKKSRKIGKKELTFPEFWDGDYNYFWIKEIARNGMSKEDYLKLNLSVKLKEEDLEGGKHVIVAKARRKGFSYKNAAVCANRYNTERSKTSLIIAFDKKYLYPTGTMGMVTSYLDFLNEYTGWAKKRDFINKQEHKKASYKYTDVTGNIIEKGYKSQVIALTCQDNPQVARGKDASLILFEEAGTFHNLKTTYFATKPTVEDGAYITGQILCYGTGGDMDAGTIDFEDMFNDPETYNFIAMENQWDEQSSKKVCGFFFPGYQNKKPFIDKDGNSLIEDAKQYEEARREEIKKTAKDKRALDLYTVENANCPKEAFLRIKGNIFPGADLQRVLTQLEVTDDRKHYWIGDLVQTDVHPFVEWKANKNLSPILNYPVKNGEDTTGCIIIYEPPYDLDGTVPDNMYIGGTDPYDEDKSQTGSLGSTFIYNRLTKKIVAEYTARPETSDKYYENVRRLLIYYNAKCLYENEKKGLKIYFENRNCSYLLADQPLILKDIVKNSTVERGKGMHMVKEFKVFGESLIKTWLIEPYDDINPDIKNFHKLRSQPLLQELIKYNEDGNFDRCLIGGTKISIKDGYKNIEDIIVGDKVLTHKGRYKSVRMIDTHITNKDILTFKVIGNYEKLVCTHNHPILVASTNLVKHSSRIKALENINFLPACDLTKKYQFVLQPKRKNLIKTKFKKDLLYLLGWYLSDGYVNLDNHNITITLQSNQGSIADDLIKIIEKYTNKEETKTRGRIYKAKPAYKIKEKGYVKVVKTSKKLSELFVKECGGPNNKILSETLYNSSGLLNLLIGFLEGDGHQKKNANYDGYKREVLECGSIYETMIKQVRQILIDENIWSSISIKKPRLGQQSYNLNISRQYINKLTQQSKKFWKVNPINIIEKNNVLETKDGFWTPIKLINTSIEKPRVYNFDIEDDHSYVASNIVTHNCMSFMMIMYYIQELYKVSPEPEKNVTTILDQDFFKLPQFVTTKQIFRQR